MFLYHFLHACTTQNIKKLNFSVNTSHSPHDTIDIPADLSRRKTIVPPPHIKQVIKSAENIDNEAPVEAQVKNYEDLRFKYKELQEENTSLTDTNNLIPKNKAPQVNEKWSTESTAKAGVINNVLLFVLV